MLYEVITKLTHWNKALEQLTGYSARDMVGTALFVLFLDVVIPEENRRVLCWVSFVITSYSIHYTKLYDLGGWASNSKYPLLGGLRASAQMISYEVSLGLSVVGVLMVFQSVQLSEIVV